MCTETRRALYEEIESRRSHPLVVFVTSSRLNAQAEIAADAVPQLLDQLEDLPQGSSQLDLLVVSQGGDPTAAYRMVSLIRERVTHLTVLVPQAAFSAATLIALGADEIVMHPNGNLGPVDPQIRVMRPMEEGKPPQQFQFGTEDVHSLLAFARDAVGLTDQQHLAAVFQQVCHEVGTVPIGVASRGSRLSLAMGEQLLRTHMTDDGDGERAKVIAEALNKNYFHHGYPVGRTEAANLGLKVREADRELEALLWKVWLDIELEMQMRSPFLPVALVSANPAAQDLFAPTPQFNLPAGAPANVVQAVLQQMVAGALTTVPATPFEVINAVMESTRRASRSVTAGRIYASRMPDLQLKVNVVPEKQEWEVLSTPVAPASPTERT